MAEVLVLGVSHKTAPLELRERLALTEGRAVGVLGELVDFRRDLRGGRDLDLQPHRALHVRLGRGECGVAGAGRALARGRHPTH